MATCPLGTFPLGTQCLRSCSQGSYYYNQICYPGSCPTGLRTDSACVTQCPAGTNNSNGVCQWSCIDLSSLLSWISSIDLVLDRLKYMYFYVDGEMVNIEVNKQSFFISSVRIESGKFDIL